MGALSYDLFWAGLIATLGASAAYLYEAYGSRVVVRSAATNAGVVPISTRQESPAWVGRGGTFLTWVSMAFLTLALITRSAATGHPPYSNMWEFLVSFGAVMVAFYAFFEWRVGHRRLGPYVLPLGAAILLTADLVFDERISPLVPALQNNRLLAVHVAAMLLSYGVFAVAFVAALLYLVQGGNQNRFPRLPSAAALDEAAYKAVVVGFPMLALGIALGAYWGNIAWGRYWGWDPKETTALVTWFVFAGYLHARSLARWRGNRAAWLIIAGFGLIVFNIFAVNFWIAGLHSYA